MSGCECICNHSGACTGCGICWLEAYAQHQQAQIRSLFGIPPARPTDGEGRSRDH